MNTTTADKIISNGKRRLNLLREIAVTEFKLKDQSTFLGFIWSFLHPLIMLIVLYVFFNARVGAEIDHYPIYLLIGIIQYTHFSNTTAASMRVLRSMKNLTSNTIFPKEILVMGSVASFTVEFVLSMIVCVGIALLVGVTPAASLVLLPVIIILQIMLVLWISLLLACLYVFVRDINHIYQVFLRVLFFMTPIFYGVSFLGPLSKQIVMLNPLAHLITFSRTVVLEGGLISVKLTVLLFLVNIGLTYLALKVFRKYEPRFAAYL